MIAPDMELSDDECDAIALEAGFSTYEQALCLAFFRAGAAARAVPRELIIALEHLRSYATHHHPCSSADRPYCDCGYHNADKQAERALALYAAPERAAREEGSMDGAVPETGPCAEDVAVRLPDKGSAAANGAATGAEPAPSTTPAPVAQEPQADPDEATGTKCAEFGMGQRIAGYPAQPEPDALVERACGETHHWATSSHECVRCGLPHECHSALEAKRLHREIEALQQRVREYEWERATDQKSWERASERYSEKCMQLDRAEAELAQVIAAADAMRRQSDYQSAPWIELITAYDAARAQVGKGEVGK